MATGVHGDVCYSKVNAYHVRNINRFGFLNLTGSKQVELAIDQGNIGLTMSETQKVILARAANKANNLSASETPDGDFLFQQTPIQDAIIVGNGPMFSEDALCFGIEFVPISHFGYTTYNYLSRKREGLSDLGIGQLVKLKLAEFTSIPRYLANRIASIVGSFKRFLQENRLRIIRQELDLGRQFHVNYYTTNRQYIERGLARFPCHLKETVSTRRTIMKPNRWS
jgi:hypothetical protein